MTAALSIAYASIPSRTGSAQDAITSADVLVVGAGISGPAAALEAAHSVDQGPGGADRASRGDARGIRQAL
jgi:hypothetical protein